VRWVFGIPIRVNDRVEAALTFYASRRFNDQQKLVAESYARQIELDREKSLLLERLDSLDRPQPAPTGARATPPPTISPEAAPEAIPDGALTLAGLTIDPVARRVFFGGNPFKVTGREYDLLLYMLRSPGVALSRERLARDVWGYESATGSNFVDVLVTQLRRQLEADGQPRLIHTVRAYGYVLRAD
jgi:DNA-binding response OmpR family regulator